MADKDNVTPYVIPLNSQKPKLLTLVPSDPGSRYKTRQLQVQIVGKSKMMKTVLVNILDVAKDMQVPPSYIGTFMGYEIGAQAKWDPKKPERQQAFLSGEHATKDLSRFALQFIQEVVLCPNCGLPEIVCEVDEGKVKGRCRACGGFEELKISNEKFKRYILNHPPSTKGGSFSGNKNVDKKEAAVKNKVLKEQEKEQQQKNDGKPSKKERHEDREETIVWYSDTSDEAARARREAMLPEALLKPKRIPTTSEVKEALVSVEKLQELKSSTGLSDADFVPLIFTTLVAKDTANISAFVQHKDLVKKFVTSNEGQLALLRSLERLVGETQTSLVNKVAHFIKELYDAELLEEDNIFAWNNDKTSAIPNVREQAAPIIQWLKEAEEESDEEGDEDEA